MPLLLTDPFLNLKYIFILQFMYDFTVIKGTLQSAFSSMAVDMYKILIFNTDIK